MRATAVDKEGGVKCALFNCRVLGVSFVVGERLRPNMHDKEIRDRSEEQHKHGQADAPPHWGGTMSQPNLLPRYCAKCRRHLRMTRPLTTTHRLVHSMVDRRHAVLVLLGDTVGVASAVLSREVGAADLLLVDRRLVGTLDLRPLASAHHTGWITDHFRERVHLLVRGNERRLHEELVLALGVGGRVLGEGLEDDYLLAGGHKWLAAKPTLHLDMLAWLDAALVRTDAILLGRSGLDLEGHGLGVGVVDEERALDDLRQRACTSALCQGRLGRQLLGAE